MKKSTRFFTLLPVALAALGAVAWASGLTPASGEDSLPQVADAAITRNPIANQFTPVATPAVSDVAAPATTLRRSAPRKAISSVSDLVGRYVMTFDAVSTNFLDGGASPTIREGSTSDSIIITNFWTDGIEVTAAVDITNKTITIPNQVVMNDATYGACDVTVMTSAGKPDRTAAITGTISNDGVITLSGYWGISIRKGTYANYFLYAGQNTMLEPANGNMHVNLADTTLAYDWAVILEQTGKNLVTVKNVGNFGKTIEIVLNSDATVSVATQLVLEGGDTYGDYYTYAADWTSGVATSKTITGAVTTQNITWGNWVMYSSNGYYTGKLADATITGIEFSIPTTSATTLTGSGTESDPFRIRTLDDLVTISDSVANNNNFTYGSGYSAYSKTFAGKYFVVENDIDMSGYRFTPIGADYNHRFAGIIDGQNHTLTGLNVSTGTNGYAGLFGYADSVSVIKNLTLSNVTVKSEYYYTGGLVGMGYGDIENCTVSGTVTSSGVACGGIAGVGMNFKNCSFSGTIKGTGGFVGGIVGQSFGKIESCNAAATITVSSETENYTGGGIVGTMYGLGTTCTDCYFTGSVDGTSARNLFIGGIVGQNFKGTVDGCFSVANVYGADTQAAVGGVVGTLNGTLTNSYAMGYVHSVASESTGGIVGSVRLQVNDGDTVQSVIKNCYFAGRLRAENYLYDSETGVRETLGAIYDGCNPTVENVYFDCQMVDYTSTHYRALTSELTSASGPSGFDASKWTFTEGYYPRLTAIADNDVAKQGASVLALSPNFPDNTSYVSENATITTLGNTRAYLLKNSAITTTGYCGSISNGSYVLNNTIGKDTLVFINTSNTSVTARMIILSVCPKAFDGNGKEDDPFLIRTKADVMKLGELTTTYDQHFNNTYFKQMNDIDMENDSSFLGIACKFDDAVTNRFGGIYDGDGHSLHNLWLYYISWTTLPTETSLGKPNIKGPKSTIYKGFVGTLASTGVVKNLTMASDCQFDLYSYAGTFVGYNYGTVENCKNYGTVRCYSSCGGGIVGRNNKTGVVRNCLNAGDVYGGWATYGGIAGSSAGLVENCMNVGNVVIKKISNLVSSTSMMKGAGGIVGTATGSILKNLVNAGHVEAPGGTVGGLFGNYSSTTAGEYYLGSNDTYCCLNYGTVFSGTATKVGSIGGSGYPSKGELHAIYYDHQVTGLQAAANAAVNSMTEMSTADLISGNAIDSLPTEDWTFTAGQYPVLKVFADVDVVKEAAKTILNIKSGQTVKTLMSDATLSDATWTLVDGTQFKVNGSTLNVPIALTEQIIDTLNVTNGGFHTTYALVSVMEFPLAGSGTLEDPFQIVDPHTWDAFAEYMALTQNSVAGKYVKIMNDINFSDTTFVPFGFDGITGFDGYLLGNNTTVSGISYTATDSYQGAICNLGESGTVQDLTLQGKITSDKASTGGFFGYCYGKVTNCVNNIEVVSTAATVGGFAAVTGTSTVFDHCINNAAVTGAKGSVGGFVGSADQGIWFLYCVNNGSITNSGTTKYAGGFIASGKGAYYDHCYNTGTITSQKGAGVAGLQGGALGTTDTVTLVACYNEGVITGASSVGGLVGTTSTTRNNSPIMADSCYNTGAISSLLKATYGTGGLFGMITGGSVISNCYNTGKVTSAQSIYNGGLWGNFIAARVESTGSVLVSDCYNTGDVICQGNHASGIGTLGAYATLERCYNTGNVEAALAASGIGNTLGNDIYINDCWNAGNVTSTGKYAGGINGWGTYRTYVTNCFNTGNVTAELNAGGLGGYTRSVYTNCYNRGTITATIGAGGLLGAGYNTTTTNNTASTFKNCYNAGMVTPTDSLCGNIMGDTRTWDTTKGNVIENTYYVTDYYGATYAADTIGGTATTVKELAAITEMAGNWSYGDEFTYPIIKGMEENACAKTFAVAVVLRDGDTYDNVTGQFFMGEQDNVTWTSSTDSIYINDYAFIGGPIDRMFAPVVMTAVDDNDQFHAPWYLTLNAETGLDEKQLADRQLIGSRYYNITGAAVSVPEVGNIYIRIDEYNDGTRSAVKVRY